MRKEKSGVLLMNGIIAGVFENKLEMYKKELEYFDTFFGKDTKMEAHAEIRFNDGEVKRCVADVGSALLGAYCTITYRIGRNFRMGLISEKDRDDEIKSTSLEYALEALERKQPELMEHFMRDYL